MEQRCVAASASLDFYPSLLSPSTRIDFCSHGKWKSGAQFRGFGTSSSSATVMCVPCSTSGVLLKPFGFRSLFRSDDGPFSWRRDSDFRNAIRLSAVGRAPEFDSYSSGKRKSGRFRGFGSSSSSATVISVQCSTTGVFLRPFGFRSLSRSDDGPCFQRRNSDFRNAIRLSAVGCAPECRQMSRRLECSKGLVGPGDQGFVSPENADELQGWERKVEKFGEALSSAFPVWVGIALITALRWPNATLWIDQRVQIWGITLTMLGMGMTLSLEDFQGALAMPKELLAGVVLQYTVMPGAGYAVSRLLHLPSHYAAGLIIVACCPGGTASNIVTYLARGNVALSVLMTAASTFLAVVMTPVLTARLVGQYISVDALSLFASTVQVVLLPVLGGAILNFFFNKLVKKLSIVSPTIAVFIVAVICAGAVGRSAATILSSGSQVVLAVLALHGTGFALGFLLSRILGLDESTCRTISIEVGMQNSVLGVVLAGQHFSDPLTAVPCAVSSVCHSLIGSTLAGLWRLSPVKLNTVNEGKNQAELS